VGPALCILQLNLEGLSAAKRSLISNSAENHKVDVICLQETHVDTDETCWLNSQRFWPCMLCFTVTPQTRLCNLCAKWHCWCCLHLVFLILQCHQCWRLPHSQSL